MFGFKQDLSYQEDLSKLVSVMERISKGELQSADENEFSHPETARALNMVLDSGLLANERVHGHYRRQFEGQDHAGGSDRAEQDGPDH